MNRTIVPDTALRAALLAACLLGAAAVHAQLPADDPDWKEDTAPPPPAFNKDKLLPIDMPAFMTLTFGVDPATLSIGKDGVVRYVMVATNSSGALNAMYEGIRCSSGEVKTYARYLSAGWSVLPSPAWRTLSENAATRHALALAYQGVCEGRAPNSVPAVIRKLNANAGRSP